MMLTTDTDAAGSRCEEICEAIRLRLSKRDPTFGEARAEFQLE